MTRDRIDELFGTMLPGTTPSRSHKAMRHLQTEEPKEDFSISEPDRRAEPTGWFDNPNHIRYIKHKGAQRTFYLIGAMEDAIGHPRVSIYKWERAGKFPLATYRTPNAGKKTGNRLYTREQISAVLKVALDMGMSPGRIRPSQDFFAHVRKAWAEL